MVGDVVEPGFFQQPPQYLARNSCSYGGVDSKGGDHADADGLQVLADPRVLTLELVSRGRKDITSETYNDHQPLELNVGARIVEVLQATFKPATQPVPQITAGRISLRIEGGPPRARS